MIIRLLIVALLLSLAGCSTSDVKVEVDDNPTQGMSPMQKRVWASPL